MMFLGRLVSGAAIGAAIVLALGQPVKADPIFTIGGTFTVTGGNSPSSFSQSVPLTVGNHMLPGGLNLNISIVPVGDAAQSEWLVFKYTSSGSPLSQPGQNWNLDQIGLPAAVPGNFTGDFTQWTDANGSTFNQTNHIFNQPLINNPVPGGTGNGEGTLGFVAPFPAGPVFDLGAFADPFSIVTNALGTTQVFGFTQALEFAPQTVTPPTGAPEPASLALLGVGLLGVGMVARRRTIN